MARTRKTFGSGSDADSTLRTKREPPSFTMVFDWVGLSGVSPMAYALYCHLRRHVNQSDGKDLAWPGKERLAVLMHFADAESLDRYLQELVDIDALEIITEGMPAHNVYVVAGMPPEDYAGPTTQRQWNLQWKAVVDMRKQAAAAKSNLTRLRREWYTKKTLPKKLPPWLIAQYGGTAPTAERWALDHATEVERRRQAERDKATRAQQRGTAVPAQRTKAQVNPVPGSSREQGEPSPVPGSNPEHVSGSSAEHVPASNRAELDLPELDLVEPKTPLPPAKRARSAARSARATTTNRGDGSPQPDNQGPPPDPEEARLQAQQELLVDELRPIMAGRPKGKPRWREDATRDVLNELRGQAPFGQIRLMMLHLANGTFGFTGHPNRALQQTGPWWEQAQTEYRKSPESWSSTSPKSCPNRCDHGWMVDPTTRQLLEPAVKCSHKAMAGVSAGGDRG